MTSNQSNQDDIGWLTGAFTGAVRRILKIQLGTKPVTRRDMEELRSILLDLQLKLNSIVNRIPDGNLQEVSPGSSNRSKSFSRSPGDTQTSDNELPGEGHAGCPEQYHTPVLVSFHKWARILLSLFIDKVSFHNHMLAIILTGRHRHSVLPTNLS